ncbi:MAG: hypothetical protein ACXWDC_03115, partial [Aeromicrobium sp.]
MHPFPPGGGCQPSEEPRNGRIDLLPSFFVSPEAGPPISYDFDAIRAEFDLPPFADTDEFPDAAEAEAKEI